MKRKHMILAVLALSLLAFCAGCASGGKSVSNDTVEAELGEIANKANNVTYTHSFDNHTKIDTVTVNVLYDNEYCKSVGSCVYQYQYIESDGIWDLSSKGNWEWDSHLKDFSKRKSNIEKFSDSYGFAPEENEDFYYFNLSVMEGSVVTENNTFQCKYSVERNKYNSARGHFETAFSYSSNGYEYVTADILPGGAVCVSLEDPSTNRSTRFWFNSEAYIDVNLFV